jgi:predicted permease
VQHLLIETLLLASLGGAVGLLFASLAGGTVAALFLGESDVASGSPDARTLLFTALLTLAVALLTGLAPGFQTLRADVASTLKGGSSGSSYRGSLLRTSLLLFRALCVVLLIGAGLFVRSLSNVRSLRLGYDADALVIANVNLRGLEMTASQKNELADRLVAAAASLPGVRGATLIASIPFVDSEIRGVPQVAGRDSLQLLGLYYPSDRLTEYFATTGTRILRGRGFLAADVAGAPPVVSHRRNMAKRSRRGPGRQAAAVRQIAVRHAELTVVGIAEDVVSRPRGENRLLVVCRSPSTPAVRRLRSPALFVRVQGRPEDHVEPLRVRLQRELQGDAYASTSSFSALIEPQQRSWRVGATMFVMFASLALVLAAIGLYGVVAYAVAQRTRELGVRVALGARAGRIILVVARDVALFALIGMVAGGAVALAAGRWIEPLLFDTSPRDPVVYCTVAGVLLLVALAATVHPAIRAARIDPTIALRAE